MRTEIIILAQGNQSRLRGMSGYKQMIPLPHCGNIPIIGRTIQQLCRFYDDQDTITTVAWPKMGVPVVEARAALRIGELEAALREIEPGGLRNYGLPSCRGVTLPDPGNSSLKGISRYLEQRGVSHSFNRTMVLFGDVIYSWVCLAALLDAAATWGFVGTSDLNASGGELWGVAWAKEHEVHMLGSLADALLRHPPFEDEYQPGQMRRWMSGWKRGDVAEHRDILARNGHYIAIDDYTQDIDLPVHVAQVPALSASAAADDAAHGMLWNPPGGAAA